MIALEDWRMNTYASLTEKCHSVNACLMHNRCFVGALVTAILTMLMKWDGECLSFIMMMMMMRRQTFHCFD